MTSRALKEPTIPSSVTPKIELHVHLEGTIRPRALLEIAHRNSVSLPAEDEDQLAELYQFRDFEHFLELWLMTTCAVQTEEDFRQVVVDYAAEAVGHGAVYIEGIFTPAERIAGGASWDEVFTGFCNGAQEAREAHGVQIRLTPDIPRNLGLDVAIETARYSIRVPGTRNRRDRHRWTRGDLATRTLRTSIPVGQGWWPRVGSSHAGEASGPESIRGAIDVLSADRIRHGVRAIEDPGLLSELAAREIVCDVCPVSNLRTGVVDSLATHPLPQMIEAGVQCSISTDDPAMFDTDLSHEYEVAADLGCPPELAFHAGVIGALCDEDTRAALRSVGESFAWTASP